MPTCSLMERVPVRESRESAILSHYICPSRLLSRSEENKNVVTNLMRQCGHCLNKEGGSVVKRYGMRYEGDKHGATNENQYAARRC